MKKILFLALALCAVNMSAQTTHHIMWGLGESAGQFSKTIQIGDSVEWMWTTSHPHNVTTLPASTETFASATSNVIGTMYTHTFTSVGVNPYRCTVHSSMTGSITVTNLMRTDSKVKTAFKYYPNPAIDVFTIEAGGTIERLQVFDMSGRLVLDSKGGNPVSKIYMSSYTAGTYVVKVTVGGATKSIAVVKQ